MSVAAAPLDGAGRSLRPGQDVLDVEADLADVAMLVHDRLAQAVLAVRFTAGLLERGAVDAAALAEPVDELLSSLHELRRRLHSGAAGGDLAAALRDRAEHRTGTTVVVDDALSATEPAVAVLADRLVQWLLSTTTGTVTVAARRGRDALRLRVAGAAVTGADDAFGRWVRRTEALDGSLRCDRTGVTLVVPLPREVAPR